MALFFCIYKSIYSNILYKYNDKEKECTKMMSKIVAVIAGFIIYIAVYYIIRDIQYIKNYRTLTKLFHFIELNLLSTNNFHPHSSNIIISPLMVGYIDRKDNNSIKFSDTSFLLEAAINIIMVVLLYY